MSDLSMYELEDNVWDEFGENDDHIVPHPVKDSGDQYTVHGGNHKKSKREIIGVASNAGNAIKNTKEPGFLTLIEKDRMLDKGSWSHTPDVVFPTSCESGFAREDSSMVSEEARASNNCLGSRNTDSIGNRLGADNPVLGQKGAADDNDAYSLQLSHISQTNNDLSFFDKDCEERENNDLLYYGWPDDIGNFDDVDRMFRSCDSTFGLGSLSDGDDLCWFSSSQPIEGSEDVSKLGSQFPSSEASALNCIAEHHEASKLNSNDPSVNDCSRGSLTMDDKSSSGICVAGHSDLGCVQFLKESDAGSMNEDKLRPKEQVNSHKNHSRNRNHSVGKRKERNLDNGNFKPVAVIRCSLGSPSHHVVSPPDLQQHKQDVGPDYFNYLQTNIPYMQMDYDQDSDQTLVCPRLSGTKCESDCLPCPSPKDSSFASNQVQSIECSHAPSSDVPARKNEKRDTLYYKQDLQAQHARSNNCADIGKTAPFRDSVLNKARECEVEGHSEIEGVSTVIPAELDSNGTESSSMSSVLDDISLEATSFRQLQQVMEQLDIRTKLCIRDSLYRLARSAEQRHNCVNNGNVGEHVDRDTGGTLMPEGANKGTGFLDMETDTNPIDRSIAHLLFHRPSDPSVIPVNDVLSLKSHTMVHGSVASPQSVSKYQNCQEESAGGADKTWMMSGDNQ